MAAKSADPLIYVTGFGPFAGHVQANASWEAVRLLPTEHLIENQQCRIKLLEIPVIYTDVDKAIEHIWQENPKVNI